VRRTASNGIGVERTFLLLSPAIDKVVVERHRPTSVARSCTSCAGLTGKKAHLKTEVRVRRKALPDKRVQITVDGINMSNSI